MVFALIVAIALLASGGPEASAAGRETVTFRLYKFQQPIGLERSVVVRNPDSTTDIRTTFAFSDRTTTVPLASNLTLGADGLPRRFSIWGSTSRSSVVDDRVEISTGKATIEESGVARSASIPQMYFVGNRYAPVILTELVWRYWATHGRPRAIPLFPSGEARIELRGTDEVTDDSGKPCKLQRYVLTGRSWGRETFWIDEDADATAKAKGRLAAFKGVDAEFDHFEANGRGYSDAIGKLVASAAADGVAALREKSRSALAEPVSAVPVAYVGATLLDGAGGPAVPDSVVVVDRGRIAAAGARDSVEIPAGARRIEAAGKTIVPGLWDMHAHFEQVEWGPVYLAAGVTTVRDCGNELDFVRSVRDTIDAGKGLGPRILLACIVDGEGPASVGTVRLRDEKGIPDLIRKFQDARCSQVKIYSSLDPRLITPLSKAAHEAGMSVTGHIPFGIGAVRAVEAGMDQINHIGYVVRAILPVPDPEGRLSNAAWARALDELDVRSDRVRSIVASFAGRGVVVDPTLAHAELGSATRATLESREPGLAKIAPQLKEAHDTGVTPEQEAQAGKFMRARLDTVRALHEGGVTIVAGTDQAVPGHSLHREMELYVSAGFTPMEALQAATIVPARVMNREKDLGTVETGKIADFLVVDGDPLADIRNLRRIALVVQAGRAYDPAPLWKMVGFQP